MRDLPKAPTDIGPYRLLRRLGVGGMGVVHAAEHRHTRAKVALKTVSTISAASLTALRGEIYVLERLHHPGIVRIVGHDLHEGVPWYAMDWVKGRSLREICPLRPHDASKDTISDSIWWTAGLGEAEVPDVDLLHNRHSRFWTLEQDKRVISIAMGMCKALAYLHGEGLLHGDLKPDNVLLRRDGTPVLVDFGLQSRFHRNLSREALEMPRRAGTGYYLAPELIRNQLPDARADLYALGCVLYEMITGQPPFIGKIHHVTWQQLYSDPPPLSDFVEDVPEILGEVVMRLLEKRPQDRFGYASDVYRALGGETDSVLGAPYLYRSAFIAREFELEILADRVASGVGGVVLLVGESGTGKTRLALEGAGAGRRPGTMVVSGSCYDHEALPLEPFRPLLQRIGDRCRAAGAEEVAAILGEHAAILGRFEPSLIDLPGQRVEVKSASTEEVSTALRQVLDAHPTVLLLDDLQWSDALTVSFLRSEAGRLDNLVIVATVRVEEADEVLSQLDGAPGIERIDVERLDRTAVGAIAAEMLALDVVPPAFAAFLYRQSEGNPLYVAEYLRSAMEAGVLGRSGGIWRLDGRGLEGVEALSMPNTLCELLERRFEGLDPAARDLADLAAVIDGEIGQIPLLAAADLDAAAASNGLRQLYTRQILALLDDGAVRLTHGKIGEVLRRTWSDERRESLHVRAADALNDAARTHYEADRHRQALAMTLRCEEIYRQVLDPGEPRLALNATALAMVCWRLGDLEAAQEHAERSLDIVKAPMDDQPLLLPMLLNNLAVVLKNRGKYADCEGLYRRCLSLTLDAVGHEHQQVAHTFDNLAQLLQVLGRYDEALVNAQQAVALSEKVLGAEHPLVAYSLNNLACIQVKRGDLDAGLELHARALAVREAAMPADHPTLAFSLNHLGNLHSLLGHRDLADQMLGRALEITVQACGPDHYNTAQVLHNLARHQFKTGSVDEARVNARRALDIRESTFGRRHPEVAANLMLLGDLYEAGAARRYRQLALDVLVALFGPEHPDVQRTLVALNA